VHFVALCSKHLQYHNIVTVAFYVTLISRAVLWRALLLFLQSYVFLTALFVI